MDASVDRPRSDGTRRRFARYGYATTALLATGYAPLSMDYMWRYFHRGGPQIQAAVTAAIDGRTYASGRGSVDWLRATTYLDNRWGMLIHTTFGGLSLLLGVMQLSSAIRHRPKLHRRIGFAFLAAMTVSMTAAITFLVVAGVPRFELAPALWLQLWVLALATLSTGWCAVAAIRTGDVVAHQALTLLCMAFLMTAPGLRALWVALHYVFPRLTLLDNLIGGAIAETVLAPTLGVAAFVLSRPGSEAVRRDSPHKTTIGWTLILSLGVTALTALHFRLAAPSAVPSELIYTYLVPAALASCSCACFGVWSMRVGTQAAVRDWHILLLGLTASGAAVNLTWFIASPLVGDTGAFLASVMITAGVPITTAGIVILNGARRSQGTRGSPRRRATPVLLGGASR